MLQSSSIICQTYFLWILKVQGISVLFLIKACPADRSFSIYSLPSLKLYATQKPEYLIDFDPRTLVKVNKSLLRTYRAHKKYPIDTTHFPMSIHNLTQMKTVAKKSSLVSLNHAGTWREVRQYCSLKIPVWLFYRYALYNKLLTYKNRSLRVKINLIRAFSKKSIFNFMSTFLVVVRAHQSLDSPTCTKQRSSSRWHYSATALFR